MKKLTLLSIYAAFATMAFAQSQVVITDEDLGSGIYNWTPDKEYLLDGFVYIESGGILNIAAGTVIKGLETPTSSDNASALIITQGAKINVNGTQSEPVIMTSELDDVNDPSDLTAQDRSLWGGLVILGNATIGNATSPAQVEGIPTDEIRAQYGGENDSDNSGSIKYLSIRHCGAELAPGNEINGLTLGGVGSETILEYIEIFASSDDGVEFFGGTPNIKNLVLACNSDDSFDWDTGFRGNGQFWFVLQDIDEADNGGELDGAIPDGQTPYSNPTVYNVTMIGSGISAAAANPAALLFRDASGGTIANSIITSYNFYAIEVEDLPEASGVDSRQRMEDGVLNLKNNIWYEFGNGDGLVVGEMIRATADAEDPTCAFLISHFTDNENTIVNPQIGGISRLPNGGLDPRPSAIGPAYNTSLTTSPDEFFTTVPYKGAFAANETNWMDIWTALSEYGYLSETVAIDKLNKLDADIAVYPNPVIDNATLQLTLAKTEKVNITLVDIQGRVVTKIANSETLNAGMHTFTIETDGLASGLYQLRVSSLNGISETKIIIN
ncbi:MAG: T9SS type A sorting domain-containing protein [Chitinophagales bacterium]|nr:T9SS type A sorting domain-containing protein [Chitinophagales bacterium]MBP8753249.1 T9SS type A sorting domain-containing protein [Chitinophagales bacterium]MBP9189389.1 T9SS type A sorting domain-containing protein [Chitinophagales bacterium]MBP9549503.1 T9SS type A sorting domain-containing protein [Chitinophagales bacterium]MBP9703477.1 T9SS type A sorting domain-containing protein [Chitinophagales bacterium]